MPVGNLIDVISEEKKLIAEIKNKYNTTKGNHKINVYNDLSTALADLDGYTGYYVEILPKSMNSYNKPFTPPDNKTKEQAIEREDIRVIDGLSFYSLITGNSDALLEVYKLLPISVAEIIKEDYDVSLDGKAVIDDPLFMHNYKKAYG